MVWVFVFLILVIACIIVMVIEVERDSKPLVVMCGNGIIFFTFLMTTFLYYDVLNDNGNIPTLNDVPDKAHVDTTITIHGSDTTYSYKLEWNDTISGNER